MLGLCKPPAHKRSPVNPLHWVLFQHHRFAGAAHLWMANTDDSGAAHAGEGPAWTKQRVCRLGLDLGQAAESAMQHYGELGGILTRKLHGT